MPARPGPRRTAVPPGAAGASTGADAARTRRSTWAALVLLVGGLSLGVVLVLVGGPWQVLAVLHLGALAIWFLVWRRGWRDLLRSAGPRSPWLLFAVGAGLCALSAVAHHPIDRMEPVHHSVRYRHARRDAGDGRSRLVPGTPEPQVSIPPLGRAAEACRTRDCPGSGGRTVDLTDCARDIRRRG
ncbi:hypothetical protein [Actinomyces naeslundii]|uniref:hypothetical protein n=1 Tax=Actinomyces naeslundii TaxID=1655 RepID=UPI000A6DBAED|nr:hypothetical protein [Actinomyces naeslundii]